MGIAAICLLACNVAASLSVLLSELMMEVPRLMVLGGLQLTVSWPGVRGSTGSWPPEWPCIHFTYS